MPRILGLSAYYHDSAAALVCEGDTVAAAQEERFTRIKHDYHFPINAAQYCLKQGGLQIEDLDYVAFYDKPLQKFDRLIETYLAYAPAGLRSFMLAMPLWLKTKLHLPREIFRALEGRYKKRIVFTSHHESHAASAYYPSPFDKAAILTVDGVGEWETATIGIGEGNKIRLLKTMRFPHSLGLLYSAITYFCGFKVNSGEYKLMGLAPYGEPKYADLLLEKIVDLKPDGSLAIDMSYFSYCEGLRMTNSKFAALFGGPARQAETPITQREMDMAASIQVVTEKAVLAMARYAREITGCQNLCMAGGVALNCVANGKLIRAGIFDQVFVQPAAGDAGGALGAALFVHYQLLKNERQANPSDSCKGSLLGPQYSNEEVRRELTVCGAAFDFIEDETKLLETIAKEIASEKVVGWFAGRMEFGPRALGSRSIIGDPRSTAMQSQMNLRIKFRESFRPFAPVVMREHVTEYFDHDDDSPYMLVVADVKKELQRQLSQEEEAAMKAPDLRKRVNVPRSTLPAITHVDMSARIQTVDEHRHGRFYRLMSEFKRQTGCAVMINTSFNIRGEPIVCTPSDAFRCLQATDMDVLVIENFILRKSAQKPLSDAERARYVSSFQLD